MKVKALKRYLITIFCVAVIALIGTRFVTPGYEDASDFQLATVSKRSFDITVNIVGVLDAARSHMVSSTIRGDKGKIIYLVEGGTQVKKGDVLVKLDPTPFEEEVRRLKGEVISLEAGVDATKQVMEWEKSLVEREIRTAEFNVRVTKLELTRIVEGDGPIQLAQFKEEMEKTKEEYLQYIAYIDDLEKLKKEGYGNPTEIILAKRKSAELKGKYESAFRKHNSFEKHVFPSLIETAKAKVEKAEMELEQTRNGGVFKIAKAISATKGAKGKLQTARSSLKLSQNELGKTTVHAPFPGIAILFEAFRDGQKRKPRVGDKVWQNQPILYLPDISSMIVKTRVREVDLHKIVLGQKCAIKVDAYPDALFEGEVSTLGILASGRFEGADGEKYFELTVIVKDEDSRMRPGMTARVTILNDQVRNVPTVPIQAIFDDGGTRYCYRLVGKEFKKVKVTLGKQNEDLAEIRSGLKIGDKVSLVKPSLEDVG